MAPGIPNPDDTLVPLILGLETPLLVISFVTWGLRIDSRCRPSMKLWWDDFFISLAMLLSIASYVVGVLCIGSGYGKHTRYIPLEHLENFARLSLIAEPLWTWEVTFVKISVAFMFLRLSRSVSWERTWKWIMYLSIFYLVASTILVLILQLTECIPLPFFWNKAIKDGHCRSAQEVHVAIIGTQVIFAFSDFQFSLLPLTFIFKLNRPMNERILVAGIMSLGLIASSIGCLKFIGFNKLRTSPDPTWVMVPWKLASFCEASIGIIASNTPPLKARGEKLFRTLSSSISAATGSLTSFTRREPMPTEYSATVHVTVEDEIRAGSTGTVESVKTPLSVVSEKGVLARMEEV